MHGDPHGRLLHPWSLGFYSAKLRRYVALICVTADGINLGCQHGPRLSQRFNSATSANILTCVGDCIRTVIHIARHFAYRAIVERAALVVSRHLLRKKSVFARVRSKKPGALFCVRVVSLTFPVARGERVDVLLKYRVAQVLEDSLMALSISRPPLIRNSDL